MKATYAILVAAFAVSLGSCSKQQDPVTTLSQTSVASDVQLQANGRLLFANNDAFQRVFDKVSKMTDSQIEQWTSDLKFHSLKQLSQPTEKNAAAAQLNDSFGFPASYAALISGNGEYQIGNRISWYHEGFRYVATSEEELAAIKANPNVATEKFAAGVKDVSTDGTNTTGTTASRTIRNNQSRNGDGKYGNYHFNLNRGGRDDPGSYRQLGFESVLYQEDATDRFAPAISGQRTYYTNIYINEYYEYYSNGAGRWYRCDDYPRLTSINLSSSGTAQGTYYYAFNNGAWSPQGVGLSASSYISTSNVSHSGGDYQTPVLQGYLSAYAGPGTGLFTWDYNISGQYTTQVSTDSYHIHTENGNLW